MPSRNFGDPRVIDTAKAFNWQVDGRLKGQRPAETRAAAKGQKGNEIGNVNGAGGPAKLDSTVSTVVSLFSSSGKANHDGSLSFRMRRGFPFLTKEKLGRAKR